EIESDARPDPESIVCSDCGAEARVFRVVPAQEVVRGQPVAEVAACALCGDPVDVAGTGFYREESGWAEVRSAGGANARGDRKPTGRVAHRRCVRYGPGAGLPGLHDVDSPEARGRRRR